MNAPIPIHGTLDYETVFEQTLDTNAQYDTITCMWQHQYEIEINNGQKEFTTDWITSGNQQLQIEQPKAWKQTQNWETPENTDWEQPTNQQIQNLTQKWQITTGADSERALAEERAEDDIDEESFSLGDILNNVWEAITT